MDNSETTQNAISWKAKRLIVSMLTSRANALQYRLENDASFLSEDDACGLELEMTYARRLAEAVEGWRTLDVDRVGFALPAVATRYATYMEDQHEKSD